MQAHTLYQLLLKSGKIIRQIFARSGPSFCFAPPGFPLQGDDGANHPYRHPVCQDGLQVQAAPGKLGIAGFHAGFVGSVMPGENFLKGVGNHLGVVGMGEIIGGGPAVFLR